MQHILEELEKRREAAKQGGGERRIANQHAKGKLTARERIDVLLDEGSFEEFDMFVEHRATDFGMADQKIPGDGVVTGHGTINGRLVYVFSKDFTVFGGSLSGAHARRSSRSRPWPAERRADHRPVRRGRSAHPGRRGKPCRLRRHLPAERDELRRHPADQRDHGPVRRRRRLFAAMTDFIFMVRDTSYMYVTGPGRGEDGHQRGGHPRGPGGRAVHAAKSGVADGAFDNDLEALTQIRRLVDFLPLSNREKPPVWDSFDDPEREEMSLDTLVPDNPNKPYDIKELILKVVDEADFFEISPDYAKNIVVGFGRLEGQTVGIVANQPLSLAACWTWTPRARRRASCASATPSTSRW
jgi:propionyl-CoA carboxylase beta chain